MTQISPSPSAETDSDSSSSGDGLQVLNYPSMDDLDNSTVHNLMKQYGFDSTMNAISEFDDDDDATATATSFDGGSTIKGPTSFPDLSYNKFETPLRRASSIDTGSCLESLNITIPCDQSSQKSKFQTQTQTQTRGHGVGKYKRRSHSAISISLSSISKTPTTAYKQKSEEQPPPFEHHHHHNHHHQGVAIARSTKASEKSHEFDINSIIGGGHNPFHSKLHLRPRRLSLSLSSMTSEAASHSRQKTHRFPIGAHHHHHHMHKHSHLYHQYHHRQYGHFGHAYNQSEEVNDEDMNGMSFKNKIKHISKRHNNANKTPSVSNESNSMSTVRINHDIQTTESQNMNALAPLLDIEYMASSQTATSTQLDNDSNNNNNNENNDMSSDDDDVCQSETQQNESSDSETDTCANDDDDVQTLQTETQSDAATMSRLHTSNCNEIQLGLAINEFFSVIDCGNLGAVTFDILKICLKLIGIQLSAYQLDILLNELTCYKPSSPISKEMMYEFLLSSSQNSSKDDNGNNKDNNKHCDNVQVTLIRTEIIVGLLSNLQQSQHSNSQSNKTPIIKKTKRRSFISKNQRILNISRSSLKSKKSQKSNSKKSKSKSPSRSSSKKSNKSKSKSKSNTPYIVKENHKRFHSEHINKTKGQIPALNANEHSLQTVPNPNIHRKPPQIRRRGNGHNNNNKLALGQLSPNSSHLPPLPPTPLTLKNYQKSSQRMLKKNVSINEYNEWLLICFKNSIIDSLMELIHCDELKVYLFDDGMICHHMLNNDALSAIEYLFECQFAFMSNGNAYLDFNGFAAGMRKCNIHFENPEVAIPLIFEQLVGIKQSKQTKKKKKKKVLSQIDYNHVFVAEDTFVEWMMNYVRMHLNQSAGHFDERCDKLFAVLHSIYKYNKKMNKKKNKKNLNMMPIPTNPVSSVLDNHSVESFYIGSASTNNNKRSVQFLQQRMPRQQYHQYAKYNHDAVSSVSQTTSKRKHDFYTAY